MKCPTCQAENDITKTNRCVRCMSLLIPIQNCTDCKGCIFHTKCTLQSKSTKRT